MTISIMKNKVKSLVYPLLSILFWILIWQIGAMILDKPYFLPDFFSTIGILATFLLTPNFYYVVLLSLLRVMLGLTFGVLLGAIFAFLSHHFAFVKSLVSTLMSVIKSTPVASFIIILWILLDGSILAIFVAVLMVMPIVWQNLLDGYSSIEPRLSELCTAYEFSSFKRFKLLTLPALLKYFWPALITASGLAWKSEIAAEIIAYTKNSIGQMINDAKYNNYENQADEVFAWTLAVIIISVLLEKLTKLLLGKIKTREEKV